MPEAPRDLLGLPLEQLSEALAPIVDRPFRSRQVFDALHRRRSAGFSEMTDLPLALREELGRRYAVRLPEIVERAPAADETVKYLLRLEDGATIETVDIPERSRRTLCISSQAGCGLACAFCVTGFWGAGRNLSAGEIVGQVRLLERVAELPETYNLVFMGMGEPLLNLDALRDAITVLAATLSPRRITVSTAGVVPGIEALAAWRPRPNLALSLHAPDDERRQRIMPINRTWPIDALLEALRAYPLEARQRITIEYLLIDGFNDAPSDARDLVRRLRGLAVKINLIPLNPDPVLPDWMRRPSPERVQAFRAELERRGARVTVRRQRGHDVAAACGQLRSFGRPPRGPRSRRAAR
ncbi:MAG TPA: 23S rRNA (adenine(2503)-C(2))-methyltransferase RlmN [Thermoanaerobaculia bacterium]|nr:23S rRNA (adenine(2503)-C(2))-methyltransferase RlmN [Thermoanaerobaculia bacterium]